MNHSDQAQRLSSLIDLILRRNFPTSVHLAHEPFLPENGEALGVINSPRFSICLSGTACYRITRNGGPAIVKLKRGEAIAVGPHCLMEPDPDSRYLALGIVFHPHMTRFLFAKKIPGNERGSHRFLLSHHSAGTMDEDMKNFFTALLRSHPTSPQDRYPRRLLEVILLKAREISNTEAAKIQPRKAYFTWQAACQFIREHLDQPIGRTDVANFLQLHPNHLSRLFTQFSGGSFNAYLLDARLDHARQLLKNPSLNIGGIAHRCGFREANYFIRCYRKKFGDSPGKSRAGPNPLKYPNKPTRNHISSHETP